MRILLFKFYQGAQTTIIILVGPIFSSFKSTPILVVRCNRQQETRIFLNKLHDIKTKSKIIVTQKVIEVLGPVVRRPIRA